MRVVAETLLHQCGNLNAELAQHAQRGADCQPPQRKLPVPSRKRHEAEHHHGYHDIVHNRRQRRHKVSSLSIQNARDYRADTVEQDLNSKDAEEEDGQGLRIALSDGKGLRLDDQRRKHRTGKRQDTQKHNGKGQDIRSELIGLPVALLFFLEQIQRQKRRGKKARSRQLVNHGRHIVCNLICRGEQRIAQGKRHRPRAQKPRYAGTERAQGNEPRIFKYAVFRVVGHWSSRLSIIVQIPGNHTKE